MGSCFSRPKETKFAPPCAVMGPMGQSQLAGVPAAPASHISINGINGHHHSFAGPGGPPPFSNGHGGSPMVHPATYPGPMHHQVDPVAIVDPGHVSVSFSSNRIFSINQTLIVLGPKNVSIIACTVHHFF